MLTALAYLGVIIFLALLLAPAGCALFSWKHLLGSEWHIQTPLWRRASVIVGLASLTASCLLFLALVIPELLFKNLPQLPLKNWYEQTISHSMWMRATLVGTYLAVGAFPFCAVARRVTLTLAIVATLGTTLWWWFLALAANMG